MEGGGARRVGRRRGGPLEEGPPGWRRSVCSRAMNYAVRRGLGPRTQEEERWRRTAVRRINRRETGRETTIYPHGPEPLPSSSSLAFHLLPPRRLHLCHHLSLSLRHYHPPSIFTDAASSTIARYADTSLQPIEIFIPARLPSQFMPRTSEMHCHCRGTGFPPRRSPSPPAIAALHK